MKIVIEKFFNTSKKDLIEVLSDPQKAKEIVSDVKNIKVLSEVEKGEGLKWEETRIMFGKEASEVMWISELDEERGRLVIEAENYGTEYVTIYRLMEQEEGVLLEMEFEGKPVSFMAKIFSVLAWILKDATKKMLEKDLEEIRIYLERK